MNQPSHLTADMVVEVMVKGRALKSGSFLFKYIKEGDYSMTESEGPHKKLGDGRSHIAFITPKKGFGTAVERNRARRRGKAALRRALSSNKHLLPSLAAFILNKDVLTIELKDFSLQIEHVLVKSGILSKP